ncbi:hypothetical protein [Sphingopyxis sp. BSNA05]|uniref:ORC-CDC6 family AAA ATPase n=1 Tax=Sphingopyxis sp. BSNA05 TaxID=1236614 RepID=UPI001C273296|nr:hypothetical protein [Sphingopyxis sp. BSNA05]
MQYPQSFSIHSLEVSETGVLLTPSVLEYDSQSGSWFEDPKQTSTIPVKSPRNWNAAPNLTRETVKNGASTHVAWQNPFEDVVANDIDAAEIPRLFVDSNENLKVLENNFDSFVEGQRGTGKTMLLRYLSTEVQTAIENNPNQKFKQRNFWASIVGFRSMVSIELISKSWNRSPVR